LDKEYTFEIDSAYSHLPQCICIVELSH